MGIMKYMNMGILKYNNDIMLDVVNIVVCRRYECAEMNRMI